MTLEPDFGKRWRFVGWFLRCFVLFSVFLAQAMASNDIPFQRIGADHYEVRFDSRLKPIVINKILFWVMYVKTKDGLCVKGLEITVDGGMPEHLHGLPTMPLVRPGKNDCEYLVEGLRFHMAGRWELKFRIKAGDKTDILTISLDL